MAKYGITVGEQARVIIERMINEFDDMEVTYTPNSMEELKRDLITTGGMHIQDLKAILILDYAFDFGTGAGVDKVAEEFVAVQDLMRSNKLDNITLYLITRNTDLYDKLKGNVSGIPGVYFESVQILLAKGDYKAALIKSVLLGEWDNSGLFHRGGLEKKTRKERLEAEKKKEMESRKNLRDELVRFDQGEPTSNISEMDFIDSAKREAAVREEERQRILEEKRAKKGKRIPKPEESRDSGVDINIYGGYRNGENVQEESTGDLGIIAEEIDVREEERPEEIKDVERPSKSDGRQILNVPHYSTKEIREGEEGLHEIMSRIRGVRSDVATGKLETDRGVISVVGDYGAGASGIVANAAEMYTLAGRNVLIIDMDMQNRMQTVYFNQYDKVVKNQRGTSMSLVEVMQGYGLTSNVVPITQKLHMLSVSREEDVELSWVKALAGNMNTILLEAKNHYDIIILDIPFRLFTEYLSVFDKVDKNIFVVENKFYKVENFIENILHPILLDNTEIMENLISKSNIIINKYIRGMRDYEGREINRRYLRRALDEIGYPYDNIGVAGEVPFYVDWEEQYLTGLRQVWKDDVTLGVFRRVFGKVIL